MSVDIREVTAQIADVDARARDMDAQGPGAPDPVKTERMFRQMQDRARWVEERLQP